MNVAGSAPTARVQFGLSSRVIGGDSDLPDWDLCNDFHPCGDNMMFYLDKRITSITTQVAAGAGWADVTRYDLTHKYEQSPDELMPVLWLDQIKHAILERGARSRSSRRKVKTTTGVQPAAEVSLPSATGCARRRSSTSEGRDARRRRDPSRSSGR